jgi:predicted  nucleic acid-binding Zn-ribbon protein
LQIENLQTHNSSLSTRNGELQHQVDKWQSLEGKGEKEAESLRKRRIELEVRVKELEVNLKESRAMGKKITKLEVFKYNLRGLPLPSTLSGFTPGDSGTG